MRQTLPPAALDIRRCPSHVEIPGNELADQLANAACQMPSGRTTATNAHARRRTEQRHAAAAKEHRRRNRPAQYASLGLELRTRLPPALSLPPALPWATGDLLAARSRHGDVSAYHHVRFHHEHAELLCWCAEPNAPEPFSSCAAANPPSIPGGSEDKWLVPNISLITLTTSTNHTQQLQGWNHKRWLVSSARRIA